MKRRIGVVVLAALLMEMVGVVPASATPAPPPCEDVAGSYPCGQLSTFEVPVPTELCSQFSLDFCLPPAEDHLANSTGALPGGATEPQLKTTSSSEGPAPAGEDLTVASAVYSKCTTACGDIDITITYALPWGGTFTSEPLSLPHASSQYAGFVIPGNVVRWWNEETRTPHVFGYRFDATQEQAGVPVMAGGPVAPGSMYEREVVNRASFRVVGPAGQGLGGLNWHLSVLDTSTDPPTLSDEAEGLTEADGSFDLGTISPTSSVLRAAHANGEMPNFFVDVDGKAEGDSWAATTAFSANFGETSALERLAGVSFPPGYLLVAQTTVPDTQQTETTCGYDFREITNLPNKWVTVQAEVHSVYGTESTYTYGAKGSSDIEFGLSINSGPWQASGEARIGIHNVEEEAGKAYVYPHNGSPDSRAEQIQVYMKHVHEHSEWYNPWFDECYRKDREYTTEWIYPNIRTPSGGVYINLKPDDCSTNCTLEPHLRDMIQPDKGFFTSAERSEDISAAVCLVICLAGRSGFGTFSKIEMKMSSLCNYWHVYHKGNDAPAASEEIFVDAGNQNDTLNAEGVPAGCHPPPLL